jgi:hypothetical protein
LLRGGGGGGGAEMQRSVDETSAVVVSAMAVTALVGGLGPVGAERSSSRLPPLENTTAMMRWYHCSILLFLNASATTSQHLA